MSEKSSMRTGEHVYKEMWKSLRDTDHWQGELIDRRKDGSFYPKWLSISRLSEELPDS